MHMMEDMTKQSRKRRLTVGRLALTFLALEDERVQVLSTVSVTQQIVAQLIGVTVSVVWVPQGFPLFLESLVNGNFPSLLESSYAKRLESMLALAFRSIKRAIVFS